MNWVGGWRNHTMKGSDTRKQREFFEKKRMQNRHNLLVSPSASHKKDNVGNMDLLTMFIVNQIALKKEHTVNPRFTHLPKSKRVQKSESGKPLELPMSPCSPSCLNLTESESHCSDQTLGLNKRKHLLDEFKFKTLSPLVESNLSDNSASACQRQIDGGVSSFSSASPSLAEAFHLQPRPTIHISPHPTTESYSTINLQPVGLCENNPWAVSYQTEASEISFAGGVQFGSTLHRESSGPSIHSAEIPLNHLETNDQEEMQHFIGLNGEISEYRKIKHHLQKESPYPPTRSHDFSESYNTDHSIHFYSQHMSGCVDCRPCKVHRTVSEHSCQSPRMFYQGEGFVTSEDVTNSVPSLRYVKEGKKQDGDSYMLHSKDILTSSHQATPSGISAPTRVMTFNQKVMRKHEHNERESKAHGDLKTLRWPIREQNCEEDQFVPSCLQTNTKSNKTHRKASPRTQDKAAQTAHFSSLTSKDASVQCCLLKPARMSIFTKPTAHIHHSRTNKAATRRQTRHSSENCGGNQFAHSEVHKMKWKTSWMTSQRKNTNQGPESIKAHESLGKSKSQAFMIKHPLPHCSHSNAPELKEQLSEKMVSRSERCEGHEE
ncbi:uncharacterized protein LOC124401494 isoform X2 [Silurus meridionalis]|uniref:Uncharacterized protein n=1 Tax=Silurus meridionalis TaxID=175797 RepID=A0A8T0AMC1_SILME|nr:uncharacterized protein LOC124401494 isoform X2 [Silurus meridionalis]KAF7694062.1 hypothetical protein HF521_007815 [Silurus meridionalis]